MSLGAQINHDLLRFLKQQSEPVLPVDIESRLAIRHSDLMFDLERFADEGYEIEFHPYLGVRLLDIPDRLLAHEITEGLNTKVVGSTLHIREATTSTTDDAWEAVESGQAPDGTMFLAEAQSGGRGRLGRQWDSPARLGLYLSLVARLKMPADKLPYMTSFVALALASTIEQFSHLPAEIKWPNDVMIGGRKVAGILVESRSTVPDTFVVGLGLNVNQSERDIPETLRGVASSLRMERRGPPQHRVRLLRQLIFYLDSVYAQVKKKKFDRVARAWSEFVNRAKRPVVVHAEGTEIAGTLVGMDLEKGVTVEIGGKPKTFKPEHVQSVKEVGRA